MDAVLNWKKVPVAADEGDIAVQVTGNADTEAVTRYFWMPLTPDSAQKFDRDDGEPLMLKLSALTGQLDKLAFVVRAAPLMPNTTVLTVSIRITQVGSGRVLLELPITLEVSPGSGVQYADGVQFVRA